MTSTTVKTAFCCYVKSLTIFLNINGGFAIINCLNYVSLPVGKDATPMKPVVKLY